MESVFGRKSKMKTLEKICWTLTVLLVILWVFSAKSAVSFSESTLDTRINSVFIGGLFSIALTSSLLISRETNKEIIIWMVAAQFLFLAIFFPLFGDKLEEYWNYVPFCLIVYSSVCLIFIIFLWFALGKEIKTKSNDKKKKKKNKVEMDS